VLLILQSNKTHRIFFDQDIKVDKKILLNKENINRLKNVLRLKNGTEIYLFNGNGKEYSGKVYFVEEDYINVNRLNREIAKNKDMTILGQSISNNKYMDLAIQKSTEIGVDKIIPIITKRSHPGDHDKKMSHWRKIIIHATEQSNGLFIPEITYPTTFSEIIGVIHTEKCEKYLFDKSGENLAIVKKISSEKILLIGPEGGFTKEEIETARNFHWNIISLGDRILRTETATIVAQTLLKSF
tara:strand:+ start:21978 stop:22700 length:723 start_codon:yes stop_codon:yes gene_type:complete